VLIPWVLLITACATGASDTRPLRDQETYLRWVAFEVPINDYVLLRWPKRKMPLRVYLPRPPEGLFPDAAAVQDSVRGGVLDWTDVAGEGLPRFEFVASAGEADIPIIWAAEPDGNWYIAHCAYDVRPLSRRFGVSRIVVTGRGAGGRPADLHDLYAVVLHEMGHALGLGGHSPIPGDIMYRSVSATATAGLSDRDRATLTALYALPIGKRVAGARRDR
jgi:hypothetical protein